MALIFFLQLKITFFQIQNKMLFLKQFSKASSFKKCRLIGIIDPHR